MTVEEQQILFTTLGASFGVLHLLLYLFSRQNRGNLYFSLFSFSFALAIFLDSASVVTGDRALMIKLLAWQRLAVPLVLLFALLFLYETFEQKTPRRFYAWLLLIGAAGIWGFVNPLNPFLALLFMNALMMGESVYILSRAVKMGREGSWIVAIGFTLFAVGAAYDVLIDLGVMQAWWEIDNGYPFGYAGLIGSMSVFLARDVARRNQRILEQERQNMRLETERRLLEEEGRRKSAELEEARQLQQSLLPAGEPEHPDFEAAFYQQTSAEVGGDYYDWRSEPEGALTLAVGDAAGHGLRAGMVAAVAKSLFASASDMSDLPTFLKNSSSVFRKMQLRRHFMALWLCRLENGRMELCSAGMPPALMYHAGKDRVTEIRLPAMPIGGPPRFPYRRESVGPDTGDRLLLASDGLIECVGQQGNMLGEARLKVLFRRSARSGETAGDTVSRLLAEVNNWRGGEELHDDLTICVVKKR